MPSVVLDLMLWTTAKSAAPAAILVHQGFKCETPIPTLCYSMLCGLDVVVSGCTSHNLRQLVIVASLYITMGQNYFALNKWIAVYNSKSHSWWHHIFYHNLQNKNLTALKCSSWSRRKQESVTSWRWRYVHSVVEQNILFFPNYEPW